MSYLDHVMVDNERLLRRAEAFLILLNSLNTLKFPVDLQYLNVDLGDDELSDLYDVIYEQKPLKDDLSGEYYLNSIRKPPTMEDFASEADDYIAPDDGIHWFNEEDG